MEQIKLSVRELVSYVYRSGDLGSEYINPTRALEGIKVHKMLQSSMGEEYQKEYYLKYEFKYMDINFLVDGRADGIFIENGIPVIDEIKSTYTDIDIIDENYRPEHFAQAMCYAYFYCLKEKAEKIFIRLRYYNIDSKNLKILEKECIFDDLEKMFYGLIDRYLEWAKLNVEHHIEKAISVNSIEFPFENYRKGQRELLIAVYQTINNQKKLFVQAPTGIGKTISVLFAALKALNKNKNGKIYYLTAKSSTKKTAKDTVIKLNNNGLKLRTTIITAKEKICCNDEFNCDPKFCPYAKNYFSKINAVILEILKSEYIYDKDFIEKCAQKYQVCPFELSLELGYSSDIVICDYNYYFDPRVAFQREDFNGNTSDILLIDEAHNLEERTRMMYSCELIKENFFDCYKKLKDDASVDKKIIKALKDINSEFVAMKKLLKSSENNNILMYEIPESFLKSLKTLIREIDKIINKNNVNLDEDLEKLYFDSVFFVRLSDMFDENFCCYIEKENKNFMIKIFLINTSEILKEILKNSYAAIFFSATLTPLKYYRQILGGNIEEDKLLSMNSPFEKDNLRLIISKDISMKYNQRDNNILRICEYIHTLVNEKKGNYIVFLPSYAYLSKIIDAYDENYDDEIIINSQALTEEEQLETIEKFKKEKNVVLFTVVGGAFSEGIDLPGDMLIGTIVVGLGIPKISFERNIIKDFFDKKYNSGYEFAYKYPGFNKILQSVGRVIRQEDDRGIALLIDSRLLQNSYLDLFPKHWSDYRVIYNNNQLVKLIDNFYNEGDS